MRRITLLIGLPGSGKTWYANTLEKDHFIDDPMSLDVLPESFEHMVIADPMLCIAWQKATEVLNQKYKGAQIDYVFFENDYEKCKANIELRKPTDNREVSVTLRMLRDAYVLPTGIKPKRIWSPRC